MSEKEDLSIEEETLTEEELKDLPPPIEEKEKSTEENKKQDDSKKDDLPQKDFQATDFEVETDGDFEYVE